MQIISNKQTEQTAELCWKTSYKITSPHDEQQPEQHVSCSEVWKWSDKRHDKVRPFLVCKVLYIVTTNVWCVMCWGACFWRRSGVHDGLACMSAMSACMYFLICDFCTFLQSNQLEWENTSRWPPPPTPPQAPAPPQCRRRTTSSGTPGTERTPGRGKDLW